MKPRWVVLLSSQLVLAGVAFLTAASSNQNGASAEQVQIDRTIEAAYKGKTLSLRDFYIGPMLEFNSNGVAVGNPQVGPWTLYSRIHVDEIKLESRTMEIRGHRLSLRYSLQDKVFQELQAGEVSIRANLDRQPSSAQDLEPLLSEIFVSPGEDFSALVPPYWRKFCSRMNDPDWSERQVKKALAQPSIVRQITNPALAKTAREAKTTGVAAISFLVNADGQVSDVTIIRPVGMGLDEKAVETVQTWKFKPADLIRPVRSLVEIKFAMIP